MKEKHLYHLHVYIYRIIHNIFIWIGQIDMIYIFHPWMVLGTRIRTWGHSLCPLKTRSGRCRGSQEASCGLEGKDQSLGEESRYSKKWMFPKIGIPPKHPNIVILSRKTHSCWVPLSSETPKSPQKLGKKMKSYCLMEVKNPAQSGMYKIHSVLNHGIKLPSSTGADFFDQP